MSHTVKAALLALALSLGLIAPIAADPLDDAKNAADAGDYVRALNIWRPLAEQGNAAAQYYLGLAYANGNGVPKDYTLALKWYRNAADKGQFHASIELAQMYETGRGVTQDDVEALKWYIIAMSYPKVEQLVKAYPDSAVISQTFNRMTPAQRAEAKRLASEWKPKP